MKYPYEQKRIKIHNDTCEVCKVVKESLFEIEWRVDWFQGNCEFEKICGMCLGERNVQEARKEKEYFKKMTPIWEKQRRNRENREVFLEKEVARLGIEIKKYDNGQWSFGDLIDWWTTTGTAINRKTRKRYHFEFKNPEKIISALITATPQGLICGGERDEEMERDN